MKLYAVINTEGDILAAANLDEKSAVRARPVADEKAGHKAVEVPVPAEHAHYCVKG